MIKIVSILDMHNQECTTIRLELRIKMTEISTGSIIKLITDNPKSVISIPKWCKVNEHELFLSDEKDGEYIYYIKKKA